MFLTYEQTSEHEDICKLTERRPLFFLAVAFLLGILFGSKLAGDYGEQFMFIAAVALGIFLIISVSVRWRRAGLLLLISVLFAGAAYANHHYNFSYDTDYSAEHRLRGYVERVSEREDGYLLKLRNVTIDGEKLGENIFLKTKTEHFVSDIVYVSKAKVYPLMREANRYGFDDMAYCRSEGVGLRAYTDEAFTVGKREDARYYLNVARTHIANRMDELFGEFSPVAKALFIGADNDMDELTSEWYRNAGMSHILAVSGLHVSIITGAVYLLLKLLKSPRRLRIILTLTVLAAYVALTGLRTSIVRAGIMSAALLFTQLRFSRSDTLSNLSLAFLVLTAENPSAVYSVAFQLSFGAVFAIICLADPIKRALKISSDMVAATFSATLAANIGTFIPVCNLNNRFWLLSPLVNIFAIPLAGIAVPYVAVSTLVYTAFPRAFGWLGVPGKALLQTLSGMASLSETADMGNVEVAAVPQICMLLVLAGVFIVSDKLHAKKRLKAVMACMIALAVSAAYIIPCLPARELTVRFPDVGAADCAVIQTPSGKTVLVDTAEDADVYEYMLDNGISADITIISHFHSDHSEGLAAIEKGGRAGKVYAGAGQVPPNIGMNVAEVLAGDVIPIDNDTYINILYPYDAGIAEDLNDVSLVMMLVYKGENVCLFTGDTTISAEARIEGDVESRILKVAHHGSKTSSSAEFIEKVSPETAIISTGKAADKEVLEVLGSANVYSTYELGEITVTVDKEIKVRSMYESRGFCGR